MPTENSNKTENTQSKNTSSKSSASEQKPKPTAQPTSQAGAESQAPKQTEAAKPEKAQRSKPDVMDKEAWSELKYKQAVEPESIEMMAGNVDEEYQLPVHEKNMVHASMDLILPFDPATGQRATKPFIQKFWPKEYHEGVERGGFAGYNVTLLHKPQALEQLEIAAAKKKEQN